MPLPQRDQAWPPPAVADVLDVMREHDAWYVGDPARLRETYARAQATTHHTPRPAQYAGGIVGALARTFWGRPQAEHGGQRGQLHIPLAADLCQASADLLFAEPPTLSTPGLDAKVQQRLDDLAGDSLYSTLGEGAEIGAALGGVYLRTTWDQDTVPDGPFLTTVHADAVVPEFRWGRLTAATIWHRVHSDGNTVWRHLERHETDSTGVGVVLHGLYEGTTTDLGRVIPLTEMAATAGLAGAVDEDSAISTESPGLALVYVPNQRPQRRWRKHPVGANLGRSDLDGVEPLMDALDETWSSWMRDIRLAKARLIVPAYMLEQRGGPGTGVDFDVDREVWSPVNGAPGEDNKITPAQFAIRVTEHKASADELIQQVLRTAGYSASTFGEGSEGGMATATEVNAREQRSDLTRDRKIRHWRPGTAQAVAKLLAVDAALFGGPATGITPADVQVTFGDAVQDSALELAQTAVALRTAQAASTKTLVQLQHPGWDEDAVTAEVSLIEHENDRAPLADPAAIGVNGIDLAPAFGG
jgi:A118 family predicted phage portal protein